MKRRTMLVASAAACVAILQNAPLRAQEAKPAYAYGTAEEIGAESVSIKGRGNNPTTTELKLTGDTRYGVVTRVEAAAIEVEALAVVAPNAAGEAFEARSLAFAKETAENPNAEAMVKALAFRVGFMRGPQGQGADAPKPIIGRIIAVDGTKITIRAGEKTYAVTIGAQAQILKAASAKSWEAIANGNRAMAQYVEATKVATVLLKMPEPQPQRAN